MTAAVYRVEVRKLFAQARVRAVLGFLAVAPWIYIGLILHQDRLPLETLYGRYLKDTGYATPLAILVYASQWLLPLIAALMAGDVFASEDQRGTLKTILTRSVDRTAVFWGKLGAAFTLTTLAVVVVAVSATVAGVVTVGSEPADRRGWDPALVVGRPRAGRRELGDGHLGDARVRGDRRHGVDPHPQQRARGDRPGGAGGVHAAVHVPQRVGHRAPPAARLHHVGRRGLLDSPSYAAPFVRELIVAVVYLAVATAIGFVAFRRRDVAGGEPS